MHKRNNWYAVILNDDCDWGTGSFNWREAVKMANQRGCKEIAEIDGHYNREGEPTTDAICVAVYRKGEDF